MSSETTILPEDVAAATSLNNKVGLKARKKIKKNTPKKIKKSSTTKKKAAKACPTAKYLEEDPFYCFRQTPVSLGFLEELADRLVKWAHKPSSRILRAFCCEELIDIRSLKTWRDRSAKLTAAYQLATQVVGVRRENLALDKKIDIGLFRTSQHNFDSGFARDQEREVEMRVAVESAQQSGKQYVILDKVPSTDLIKSK